MYRYYVANNTHIYNNNSKNKLPGITILKHPEEGEQISKKTIIRKIKLDILLLLLLL